MAFRLGYPGSTPQRCRGCRLLAGNEGRTIATEREAAAFTSAMRAHPEAWTPRDMEPGPIRVGETILLEPCVAVEVYERQFGKPCPRVELMPENEIAWQIVMAALPQHTRPLLPAVVEALTAELDPEDARRSVLDALEVLQGPTVNDWLRAQLGAALDDEE